MSATIEQTASPTAIIREIITDDTRTRHEAMEQIFYAHSDEAIAADNLRQWVETLIADGSEGLTKALAMHAAALADWPALVVQFCADDAQSIGLGDYEDSLPYRMGW